MIPGKCDRQEPEEKKEFIEKFDLDQNSMTL